MHIFYKPISFFLIALLISSCNGSLENRTVEPPKKTIDEQFIILENIGALPILEREDTIKGIDYNFNGVRDDIEKHISKKFPASQHELALRYAKIIQLKMEVDKSDYIKIKEISNESSKTLSCIFEKIPDPIVFSEEIISVTTNTKKRLLAYLNFSKSLNGKVLSIISCE